MLTKATPFGTLTYTYDAAGNNVTLGSSNVGGASMTYAYDALNRLASVTDASGVTSYSYDAVDGAIGFMPETPKKLIITRLECPDDAEPAKQEHPSWLDIEAAIRRLDGDEHTLVVLGFDEAPGPHMAVGGGESDRYIVCTTKDNLAFHIATNPKAPDGKCMLVAGGQYGDYPLKNCVSLSDALRAAKTYAETGENDISLNWQRRG